MSLPHEAMQETLLGACKQCIAQIVEAPSFVLFSAVLTCLVGFCVFVRIDQPSLLISTLMTPRYIPSSTLSLLDRDPRNRPRSSTQQSQKMVRLQPHYHFPAGRMTAYKKPKDRRRVPTRQYSLISTSPQYSFLLSSQHTTSKIGLLECLKKL